MKSRLSALRRAKPRPSSVPLCLGLVLVLLFAAGAQADVFLNELIIQGPERVELFNSDPSDPIDVSGWEIVGDEGTYVLPPGTIVPPLGYRDIVIPVAILADAGGETDLIDPLVGVIDGVFYGQVGSAPLPHLAFLLRGRDAAARGGQISLARSPDASNGVALPPDPLTDGLIWTIDFSSTFGNMNDAPQPQMGSSIILNEIEQLGLFGGDFVELFNPTTGLVDVSGYILTNGATQFVIPLGFIPSGGFFQVLLPPGFELEEFGLLYLFDSGEVRIDQLGFWDAPPVFEGECLGRCPDGNGPNLGFDYATSGGVVSFPVIPCTPGNPNDCPPSGIEDDPWWGRVHEKTWGRLRWEYR